MRLAGKKALITGAGSGIGAASARLFAAEGAQVYAVDIPDGRLAACHGEAEAISCFESDITEAGAPEAIVSGAVTAMGGLDIVMNNAGLGHFALIEDTSDEIWQKVMDVNLNAPFKICQAATPHLKQSEAGRIINVA